MIISPIRGSKISFVISSRSFTFLRCVFFSSFECLVPRIKSGRRTIAYSPALSKHRSRTRTIIKNNELALLHEGNVLERVYAVHLEGEKKGGG